MAIWPIQGSKETLPLRFGDDQMKEVPEKNFSRAAQASALICSEF